jgi:nucleoside-diphosphate-sugar epimerase
MGQSKNGEIRSMKILVTGGAGYIGSTLVPELLNAGHEVCVYDSLLFGGNSMFPHFKNKNFSMIVGDIRDTEKLKEVVIGKDVVIHLAAIVGYPACEKDHQVTKDVNLKATKALVDMLDENQVILFGSTGSNYGKVEGVCTEESPLNPLSLYGETKTEAEQYIMSNSKAVAYRFATAFGLSPRLRLDLLVNDFTTKAIRDKYIVVYESHFMRTFIHVYDIARSFMFALENLDKMIGNVYNVGSDKMNHSKKEVCEKIQNVTPYFLHLADIGEDADKRDYVVSYDKISELGFETTIDLDSGVRELVNGITIAKFDNHYSNV